MNPVKTLASPTLPQVLSIVGSEKRNGKYQCPACGKFNLSVSEGTGSAMVHCWTPDCAKGAAWERITNGREPKRAERKGTWPDLTLASFAKEKGMEESWLERFGVYERTRNGSTVLVFPYHEGSTRHIITQNRIRGGEKKMAYEKGDQSKTVPMPYGLQMFAQAIPSSEYPPSIREILGESRSVQSADHDLVLCEGESDTITLQCGYGIRALGIPGVDAWRPEFAQIECIKSAKRIFICKEPDQGAKFVAAISKDLPADKLYVVTFPPDAQDVNELHKQDRSAFLKRFVSFVTKLTPGEPVDAHEWVLSHILASEIVMRIQRWLWPNRIPMGHLTIFAGMPGKGKSVVALDIAARLTKGLTMPLEQQSTLPPSEVIILASEDDLQTTIRPRLEAAGADMDKVVLITGAVKPSDTKIERHMALDTDLGLLKAKLATFPGARLVIFDPITSYIGKLNAKKDEDIRPMLEKLRTIAEESNACVVALMHFNKSNDQAALHRVSGAGAWTAVPRALWNFAPAMDEEGEHIKDTYVMVDSGKGNLTQESLRTGLKFQTIPVNVPIMNDNFEDEATLQPHVEWLGTTGTTIERVFQGPHRARRRGPAPVRTDAAERWLRAYLMDGEKKQSDVVAAAKEVEISDRTLKEARKRIGVIARPGKKNLGEEGWYLSLPAPEPFGVN